MITKKHISILLCGFVLFAVFAISCSEDRTSTGYETHPTGWMNPASEEFHGQAAVPSGGESCGGCHVLMPMSSVQPDPSLVSSGSCFECHHSYYPHLWESTVSGHKGLLSGSNWNFAACKDCHGEDFAGGSVGPSCLDCHGSGSVAALTDCNLCHAMPPTSNAGLPNPYDDGAYGAHAAHSRFACTECHAPVDGLDHIDGSPAEVNFGNAEIATAHGYQPIYAPPVETLSGNGGCGSVYCHSGEPVSWLGDPVGCGACHAVLPPPPGVVHEGVTTNCHLCHPHINPASDYSTPEGIVFLPDLEYLHVNGVANAVFP